MRSLFIVMFMGLMVSTMSAQHVCGTEPYKSPRLRMFQANPISYGSARSLEITYLPVTVHTVGTNQGEGHYSTLNIMASICQLNEDFAESNIQFYLEGDIRRINRTTYYNHQSFNDGFRMMQSNNRSFTINVYVTEEAPNNACGYYQPSADAIVVRKRCMGGGSHTLTHELGHYLDLPHTFLGWESKTYDPTKPTPLYHSISGRDTLFVESVSGKNCHKAGDGFCDTPPDYLSEGWSCNPEGFSQIVQQDPEGVQFQSDASNFMSYSGDQCQSNFSPMQMDAMHHAIAIGKQHFLGRKEVIQPVASTDMTNLYPKTGEAIHYKDIELEWEHHFNATQYLIQISRFSFYGTIEYEFYVTASNRVKIGDLPVDRKFYWRVKPMNPFDLCTEFTDFGQFSTFDITQVEEVDEHNKVDIYPTLLTADNRTVNIEFAFRDITSTQVEFFNLAGQSLLRDVLDNPGRQIRRYDLSGQPAGSYLLRIATERGSVIKRLMLQ